MDLPRQRPGGRVRVAGCVITRQRPGTAKGFVFLTLEDETGISNVIITPDVYDEQRLVVVEAAFVIVEGILQHQDGVTAVKAERLSALAGRAGRRSSRTTFTDVAPSSRINADLRSRTHADQTRHGHTRMHRISQ